MPLWRRTGDEEGEKEEEGRNARVSNEANWRKRQEKGVERAQPPAATDTPHRDSTARWSRWADGDRDASWSVDLVESGLWEGR